MPLPEKIYYDLTPSEIFEAYWGHTPGNEPAEMSTLKGMASEFAWAAYKLAPTFIRQVAVEGTRAGLPKETIPYLYWVIFDNYRNWPPLQEKPKQALVMAKTIAGSAGGIPNYGKNLPIPAKSEETLVDRALVGVAAWCLTTMVPSLKRSWNETVSSNAKFLPKVGINKGPEWLDARFRDELMHHPQTMVESAILTYALNLIQS